MRVTLRIAHIAPLTNGMHASEHTDRSTSSMNAIAFLQQGWHALWELRPPRQGPTAARLLVASLLAVALALGLMTTAAIFDRVERPHGWWASLLPNIGICLCIVHSLFGVLRLAARWLPASLVERMATARDLRAGLALGALALAGIIGGMTLGFTIVPWLVSAHPWGMFITLPPPLTKVAVFLLFVMAVHWAWWHARLRAQQLQSDATEARLRLLQGQIEPHLLFNTLANIQSLMAYDPPRAQQMIATFSQYLRASLSQLRHTESTLEAELEMAGQYLALLQMRMEERLQYRIEASAQARLARMPPLLLQPLVENAVQHGLDPKLEGGSIVMHAVVRAGHLEARVVDDGVGLAPTGTAPRPGAGMALANLRARLQAQFGADASLLLHARDTGTEAVLVLPYVPASVAVAVAQATA